MEIQTLEDLKRENSASEAENGVREERHEEKVHVEEQLDGQEDNDERGEEESDAEEINGEAQGQADETDEVEPWMQEDGDGGSVPVKKHAAVRGRLKATIAEKDSELEELRQEIAALKSGSVQQPVQQEAKPMPTLDQFDYDETQYQQAMSKWYQDQVDAKFEQTAQTKQQQIEQERQQREISNAVDNHYNRAAELIEKNGISEDLYRQSDERARQVIDEVYQGQGDAIADALIAKLGDGSEKVMYALGRNKAFQGDFKAALQRDPLGIEAAILLGQKKAEFALPAKRTTKAPPPAHKPRGDEGAGASNDEKKLKRRYQDAHKRGDTQAAFSIRREAKRAKVNTNDW